ncbi:MAG: SDR family NAD(P)-dependent oxidoreductase [Bacteroidales bacterium]|nr:SDR family NAD(P)-dependent oxidoreductase [Bacteroidales bacterium]
MIIITGASKGIGNFLFEKYKEKELNVLGTFNSSLLDSKNQELLYKVDISNFSEVKNWIEQIENKLEKIVLINCAGISYNSFAHKAEVEKWEQVIKVNLIGTFNVIRCLLPIMRRQNFGRVINFSSVAAQMGTPGVSAYAASKSALWGMTKSLAVENGSKGITINNINLGYADIGMGVNDVPEEYTEIIKNKIPSKEFCSPDDIHNTVEFLINTSYINGSSVDLNGGIF